MYVLISICELDNSRKLDEMKEMVWEQIREPVILNTHAVRMTLHDKLALSDDIDVVIKPSERCFRDRRIGWCKKPRSRFRTCMCAVYTTL